MLAVSNQGGGCGGGCHGIFLAADDAVGDAVGGRDVGAVRGEDMQLRIGRAGRPGRDAVVLQDEPVIPGEHLADSECGERVLQFG